MPEIQIRHAKPEDTQMLLDFEHDYATQYVWQMERTLEEGQIAVNFREIRLPRSVHVKYPHTLEQLEAEFFNDCNVLVALIKEVPVGYVRFSSQLPARNVWVSDLVVRETLRRRGIASGLLLAVQEWAVKYDFRRILLEIQSKNHAAIRLALKLGFEFCGYHDHYYENQDIAIFYGRYLR
jgi:ribosomal protein S18 acetylase RimI-like enzyme